MRSRKTRVWVVIAFIIIVVATVTIVLRYVNNQRVQRQNQIIMRYDRFNLSAYLKGDVADINYNWQYHPYSEIDETKLSIALHVYNHYCDRNLCLNDFETFYGSRIQGKWRTGNSIYSYGNRRIYRLEIRCWECID